MSVFKSIFLDLWQAANKGDVMAGIILLMLFTAVASPVALLLLGFLIIGFSSPA